MAGGVTFESDALRQTAEQDALSNILNSQSEGGAAIAGQAFGAGADVPGVLRGAPASEQLLRESVLRDTGQSGAAVQSSRGFLGAGSPNSQPLAPSPTTQPLASGVLRGGAAGAGAGGTDLRTGEVGAGGAGSELRSIIEQRQGGLLDQPQLSREQLQQREFDAIQGQVDAINAQFDQRVREENRLGEGRVGRASGLNVASGTQFSPFGAARTDEVERRNQQVVDAVNAERAAEIAGLFTTARDSARDEARSQQDQLRLATDSFISNIATSFNLSQQEQESLRGEALRRAQLTGVLDGETTLDAQQQELSLREFLLDETVALDRLQREKGEFDLLQQQAFRENRQLFTDDVTGVVTSVSLTDPTDRFDVFKFSAKPTSLRGGDAVDRNDPLVREALTAYTLSGGRVEKLSPQGIRNVVTSFEGLVGNQSPADLGSVFPRQGEVIGGNTIGSYEGALYNSVQSGEVPIESLSDREYEVYVDTANKI